MAILNNHIFNGLNFYESEVAQSLATDVFAYYGDIRFAYLPEFKKEFETLAEWHRNDAGKPDTLSLFLNTPGGQVELVEKMVEIMRHYYQEVWVFVPEIAMSAGTILCMSGDRIFMDYASSLGPIDPQFVNSDGELVPALNYLDQVEKYIRQGSLSPAELVFLQGQDIAQLRSHEQAKNLSVSLMKKYLVEYKFRSWTRHSSSGKPVTLAEKQQKAEQIAEQFADHNDWYSHERMIGMNTLRDKLRLQIEDIDTISNFGGISAHDRMRKQKIMNYHDFMKDFMVHYNLPKLFRHFAINSV